jgi:hypothetical protein
MIYALIALIALVSLGLVLLRTNTGVVFLAVCAGSVLLSAAGKETDLVANAVTSTVSVSIPSNAVQAFVVLLPGILSALLLRKRVPQTKMLFIILPAICSATIGLTLVFPFLTPSFQHTLSDGKGWSLLANNYELLVLVGIVSSLFTIALTIPKHKDHHKKGKH